ncbi:MAG TPA: O-antigen ligase family protein, partial [Ohtaekwangia sp.]
LAHLIFPVIIFCSNLGKEQFRKAGYFLCLGVVTTSAICLVISYRSFLQVPDASLYNYITYEKLLEPLDLHANFYALFPCFGSLFLIHETAFEVHSKWVRGILATFALYMLALVFLIQSRAPIAALLLILVAGTLYWVLRNRQIHRITRISVVVALVTLVGWLFSNKSIHGRFSFSIMEIKEHLNTPDGLMPRPILSIVEHLRCWYCATHVLSDYHFFTGYGTGDERDVLTQCYQANGWTDMAQSRFTSHNEYFSSLIRNGLTELLILIGLFLIPFYQSLKANDILYASFILLWILVLLFSSLHRQSLITFYTLFNALLFKIMLQRREFTETTPGKSTS